jgi:hypothetical protein
MRAKTLHLALFTTLLVAGASGAKSEEAASDRALKSSYWLLNPTPDPLLRDMTTDRPDTTESPFTIDAGRVQVETNAFGYSRSAREPDQSRTDTYEVGTTNVRIGVTSFAEIDVVWQPYGVVKTHSPVPGQPMSSDGIGSVDLRVKVNLWGNDTFGDPGTTALGLLPFVTLPTDDDNGVGASDAEAGLIVPFAVQLTDKVGLGLNAGFVSTKSDGASSYHTEYLASASFSYEWNDRLGTYYEIAGQFETDDPRGDPVVLATGVTYAINDNTQLDAGINVGVSRAADRINPFVGISRRF